MGGWKEVDWIKIPDTELAMIQKGTGSWGRDICPVCQERLYGYAGAFRLLCRPGISHAAFGRGG